MSAAGVIQLELHNYGVVVAEDSPALSLLSLYVNEGLILLDQAKLAIPGACSNNGTIELGDAMLSGGTIENTGVLRGDGFVTNSLDNTGRAVTERGRRREPV